MIPTAMMALIEDHKGIVSQFDVPSPETVQKHLRYHAGYSSLLHCINILLFGCKIGLNSLSFGNSLVLSPLPMHTNHLIMYILLIPVQLYVILPQSLPKIPRKCFILHNMGQSLLDSFSLLLDQLNGIGQKDNFLACTIFAQVVVHRTYGYSCLAGTCWQVDDAISVLGVLEQSSLEISQTYLEVSSLHLQVFLLLLLLEELLLILDLHLHILLFKNIHFLHFKFLFIVDHFPTIHRHV